ncbi:MAG: CHAP domain-containing protein [Labilithrix sp.]|nr:CHAP domain-containing protein [Labilithrix sp.]
MIGCVVPLAAACAAPTDEEAGSTSAAIVMPACGTPLNEIDGVWAYSNGWAEGTGQSCAGVTALGTLRYQCVEYAQRYMNQVYGITPVWPVAYAAQMCASNPAGTKTHWVGDGYQPKRGDLVVWRTNTWGHVAVIKRVVPGGLEIVEQNGAWSANGTRTLTGNGGAACFISANANTGSGSGSGGSSGGTSSATGTCGLGDGLYCGGNGAGTDKGALYRCTGGRPTLEQRCSMGCEWMPDGQNDRCRTNAHCPLGNGHYCGGNGVSGSSNVLFDCRNGVITPVERCANGCRRMPNGLNDVCGG